MMHVDDLNSSNKFHWMDIIPVIALGLVAYFVYQCAVKSKISENTTENVRTLKQVEEPDDYSLNVTYHNHDYTKRGNSIMESPGLYGTIRRTFMSPSGNIEMNDGF